MLKSKTVTFEVQMSSLCSLFVVRQMSAVWMSASLVCQLKKKEERDETHSFTSNRADAASRVEELHGGAGVRAGAGAEGPEGVGGVEQERTTSLRHPI